MWRTVRSPNRSAEYDDGSVTISAIEGGTRVSVVARQRFFLPPPFDRLDVNLDPELTHPLVAAAYGNFFERTLDNFEAVARGEECRIGTPWPESRPANELVERFQDVRRRGRRWTERAGLGQLIAPSGGPAGGGAVDEDGFVHFDGPVDSAGPRSAAEGRAMDLDALRSAVRPMVSGSGPVARSLAELWMTLGDAVMFDLGLSRRAGD
jgi:hypothetical protein